MLKIINAHIKPITSPDFDGELLIDGGKIAALGRHVDDGGRAEVYDARGNLVTPGLIDAHTHVGIEDDGLRWEGSDLNERSAPATPHLRAEDGLYPQDAAIARAARAGVTTAYMGPGSANVIGGTFAAIKLRGRSVGEMLLKAPIAMKIALGENPKSVYGRKETAAVTRMDIAAILRDWLDRARRYNDKKLAAGADESKMPEYDRGLEAMLPVIRKEIPLKAHAHRADDILTAVRIAREADVDLTLDHVTEGILVADVLAKEKFPVLVGPIISSMNKPEVRNHSLETAGVLARAGLKVCIITDAPMTPLFTLPVMAGLAIRGGLDEETAWRAVTINPASVARLDDRIGSLEVGKDADIAIFDGNPLRDVTARAVRVYIVGELVSRLD